MHQTLICICSQAKEPIAESYGDMILIHTCSHTYTARQTSQTYTHASIFLLAFLAARANIQINNYRVIFLLAAYSSPHVDFD